VHERCYSVVAARRYGEGDEVKIEYGAWGNAGLLEHYGFVMLLLLLLSYSMIL
jgi:hypothetical protein